MKPGAKVDAALGTIACAFGKTIQPGEVTGTLIDDSGELEVEVILRVKRRVSMSESARLRARAMTLLAAEPWRDRCPATVKNRGPWAISKSKPCGNKVAVVVVCNGYDDMCGPLRPGEYRRQVPTERYHFTCAHHADSFADVLAVVRLEQHALRTLRSKRQAESDARAAAERTKERDLEAEVRTLSDGDLARRLAEFMAAHAWGSEDVCLREQRRRERERAPKGAA